MTRTAELEHLPRRFGLTSRKFRISYKLVGHIAALIEAAIVVIVGVATGLGYRAYVYGAVQDFEPRDLDVSIGLGVVSAILYVLTARFSQLYQVQTLLSPGRRRGSVALRWLFTMLLLTLILFLLKAGSTISRGSIVLFAVLGLVALLGARLLMAKGLRAALRSGALAGRPAVVIGEQDELLLLRSADLLSRFGIEEVGRVPLSRSPNDNLALGQRDVAAVDHALDIARRNMADEIVLAMQWQNARRLELIRERLRISPLPARLLPDKAVRALIRQATLATSPFISLEVQRGPLTLSEQIQKRTFDLVLAALALLILLPLQVLVAVAVRLDSPGPVFFRQHRKGFNGRPFMIFKFRSMSVLENGADIEQARKHDPRVTRVGRVLRRTSIDELPQLLNVIRGEMSLIGPRPHALAHDDMYSALIATYAFRHHMKPGISGWAQINGSRGETADVEQMRRRVELDLWYINNWSILLDCRIAFRTCFAVADEKAY